MIAVDTMEIPDSADFVIIGGGVMGASIAYHLAKRGQKKILLLEKDEFFGQGATGRCAGGIRYQFATEVNIQLSIESLPMLERFESEIGQAIGYNPCGYLFLLSNPEDERVFKKNIALQLDLGIDTTWLEGNEIRKMLPEMNLVILDDSGFYSGHALIFPIRDEAYEKLRSRKMTDKEFRPEDLNDPKLRDRPVFYGFDITADCNDNIYYLVGKLFRALQRMPVKDYVYCATPYRFDNFRLNKQLGLQIIWEEVRKKNLHGMDIAPRFQEGNFRDFLSEEQAS